MTEPFAFKTKVLPRAFLVGDVGFGLRWAFQTLTHAAHHVMLFRKIHKVPAANGIWDLLWGTWNTMKNTKAMASIYFNTTSHSEMVAKLFYSKYREIHPETVERSGIGLAPQSLDVPCNSTQLALYCAFVLDQGQYNICRKRSLQSSKHPSGSEAVGTRQCSCPTEFEVYVVILHGLGLSFKILSPQARKCENDHWKHTVLLCKPQKHCSSKAVPPQHLPKVTKRSASQQPSPWFRNNWSGFQPDSVTFMA